MRQSTIEFSAQFAREKNALAHTEEAACEKVLSPSIAFIDAYV